MNCERISVHSNRPDESSITRFPGSWAHLKLAAAQSDLTKRVNDGKFSNRRAIALSEVLIALVMLALLAAFALAASLALDSAASRAQCASNLRQLGQALLNYSYENKGRFPLVESDPENPTPTWGTPYEDDENLSAAATDRERDDPKYQPKPNDITAGLICVTYSREHMASPELLVCPATHQTPWDFGGAGFGPRDWRNWKGKAGLRQHLSYSYMNPYGAKAVQFRPSNWIGLQTKDFVLMADMNPGTEVLTKLKLHSSAAEMRAGNSPNHSRDGQNVLYVDGRVEFKDNPFVGVKRDNIFTYGPSGESNPDSGGEGIVGPPGGFFDSVLLPTASDLNLADPSGNLLPPTSPQPVALTRAVPETGHSGWLVLLVLVIAVLILLFVIVATRSRRAKTET